MIWLTFIAAISNKIAAITWLQFNFIHFCSATWCTTIVVVGCLDIITWAHYFFPILLHHACSVLPSQAGCSPWCWLNTRHHERVDDRGSFVNLGKKETYSLIYLTWSSSKMKLITFALSTFQRSRFFLNAPAISIMKSRPPPPLSHINFSQLVCTTDQSIGASIILLTEFNPSSCRRVCNLTELLRPITTAATNKALPRKVVGVDKKQEHILSIFTLALTNHHCLQ